MTHDVGSSPAREKSGPAGDAVVTPRGLDADELTGIVPEATTSRAKTGKKPRTPPAP